MAYVQFNGEQYGRVVVVVMSDRRSGYQGEVVERLLCELKDSAERLRS